MTFAIAAAASVQPLADAALIVPLSPALLLCLCAVAGIATVFILPGGQEPTIRKIGGVTLAVVALIFAAMLPSLLADSHSSASVIYFWIFSAIALAGAVRVVTHPKPVYSALYFVLTVFASGGLFVLLEAQFMAAALILIYAGAILITYVFVIMLASQATGIHASAEYDSHSREPLAAAAIGFALMAVLLFVIFDKADGLMPPLGPGKPPANTIVVSGATQELGLYLFEHQLVQLELAGVILLVSMVGAIVISRRRVILLGHSIKSEVIDTPAAPTDDDPHSLPVYGTENPRQKAYPQN